MGRLTMSMIAFLLCLSVLFLLAAAVNATVYQASETAAYFGNLAQPFPFGSESDPNPYVCTETAVVNSFVYLQNQYSSTYGTKLVPNYNGESFTSFDSMDQVARTLNDSLRYIPTTWSGNDAIVKYGTAAWGTYHYVWDKMGGKYSTLETYFYAEAASMSSWGTPPGSSSWETNSPNDHVSGKAENPTWGFLYNGLSKDDAVVFGWNSPDGTKGHYMTLTSLYFNSDTMKATISYVDPKDGAQYNNVPIYLNPDGTIGFQYANTGHPWYTGNVDVNMALVFGPTSLSSIDPLGVPSLPSAPVPLPPSLLLLAPGMIVVAALRRRFMR